MNHDISTLIFKFLLKHKIVFYLSMIFASVYFFWINKNILESIMVAVGSFATICFIKEMFHSFCTSNKTDVNRTNKNNINKNDYLHQEVGYKDWINTNCPFKHIRQFFTNLICIIKLRFIDPNKITGQSALISFIKVKMDIWFYLLTCIETLVSVACILIIAFDLFFKIFNFSTLLYIIIFMVGLAEFVLSAIHRIQNIELSKIENTNTLMEYNAMIQSNISNIIATVAVLVAIITSKIV